MSKRIKLYPGANTSQGFYSFYEHIQPTDANKMYIIKGGPGVGKSSFMKKIAEDCLAAGFDVELHYCSSDNHSVDGIVIPDLRVSMIDGTAPHIVDPKLPGAEDTIIHLGDYWNEGRLREQKPSIVASTRIYQRHFRKAYAHFQVASIFWQQVSAYYHEVGAIKDSYRALSLNIAQTINDKITMKAEAGRKRHLFASAMTPKGCVNGLDTWARAVSTRVIIREMPCMAQNLVVDLVKQRLDVCGMPYTAFHCSLHPEKIEHLYIPQVDTAIITNNEYHGVRLQENDVVVAMHDHLDKGALTDIEEERGAFYGLFQHNLNQGINYIGKAKAEHDVLETNYIPNMDFNAIDNLRAKISKEILSYA